MLHAAAEESRAVTGQVSGSLRIGLMPTFTRAALAPTLKNYVREYPDVKLKIIEGYSGLLTEMVFKDELDFAVVPTFEGRLGLKSRMLARDREMLISGKRRGFKPLAPIRIASISPLKLVVPGIHNVRRRNLETYFQSNGVSIDERIEMDAMIGTLEFVARSDWVTILPALICVHDLGKTDLVINPIVDPPLYAEYIVIEASRRPLGQPARLFLERLETEVARIRGVWRKKLGPAAYMPA